jgi:hypothetical protein
MPGLLVLHNCTLCTSEETIQYVWKGCEVLEE